MTTAQPDAVRITTSRSGPYIVTGPITITDHDHMSVPVPPGTAVALCRCGQSENKPFCDGTHAAADFDGTLRT